MRPRGASAARGEFDGAPDDALDGVSGSGYGSGSTVIAGPSGDPIRTSPLCAAAICNVATRSLPPPGATAALSTVPQD